MKLLTSIGFNGLLLGGFAILTAAALAAVNQLTLEPIAKAEQAAAQKALLEILPAHTHDNELLNDTLKISDKWRALLHTDAGENIYRARVNGEVNAVIIPAVAPDGYSGKIKMIVGIRKDNSIAGVRVIKHTETPGLGDKVELKKSEWILTFNDKSFTQPILERWKVKKDGGDFDQFTGATITPRATIKQIKQTLEFAKNNHNALFEIKAVENHAAQEGQP